jgi:hypothetical protein
LSRGKMKIAGGRLRERRYFGGRSCRLYSDGRHQLKMFSPSTCNFFVPFA